MAQRPRGSRELIEMTARILATTLRSGMPVEAPLVRISFMRHAHQGLVCCSRMPASFHADGPSCRPRLCP